MDNIKITPETKKIAKEQLEGCPYLHNIKKEQSVWAEIWANFCPKGGEVSYFAPDNEEKK